MIRLGCMTNAETDVHSQIGKVQVLYRVLLVLASFGCECTRRGSDTSLGQTQIKCSIFLSASTVLQLLFKVCTGYQPYADFIRVPMVLVALARSCAGWSSAAWLSAARITKRRTTNRHFPDESVSPSFTLIGSESGSETQIQKRI